jgi:hypothetical protein
MSAVIPFHFDAYAVRVQIDEVGLADSPAR